MDNTYSLTVNRDIESLNRFRLEFTIILERAGIDENLVSRLELCTYEVLINIIEHSDTVISEPVTVECSIRRREICIRCIYKGDGFDPTAQPQPDIVSHFHEGKKRGLGLYIISTLMDSLGFTTVAGISTLTMRAQRQDDETFDTP